MSKLPFDAHIVTHPSEMTQFADIVLPAPHHMCELNAAYLKSKANLHGYLSLHQQVIKPLWDVRQEETEVVWMLAQKLKEKGFDKLHGYLANEFKNPETGRLASNGKELAKITVKIHTAPIWNPKEPLKGDRIAGWEDLKRRGMYNSESYTYKKRWGNFSTATKKFEFYSATLKKALKEHGDKHKISIDEPIQAAKYTTKGELAFAPHSGSAIAKSRACPPARGSALPTIRGPSNSRSFRPPLRNSNGMPGVCHERFVRAAMARTSTR